MIALLYPLLAEAGGELVNHRKVNSIVTGVGKKCIRCADVINAETKTAVLFGTAGGIERGLSNGDIIVCYKYFSNNGRYIIADMNALVWLCDILEQVGVSFLGGSSVTISEFGKEPRVKATVVDMEDFYLASALKKRGISLVTVRVVSDLLSEKISSDELRERIPDYGRMLREKVLLPFLNCLDKQKSSW